jgi:hypothetical protein
MSITARGIKAKEKKTKSKIEHHRSWKKKENLFIKKLIGIYRERGRKVATIKRIVRWVKCKWGTRSKCMQEQIQQSNAIQHFSGQCTEWRQGMGSEFTGTQKHPSKWLVLLEENDMLECEETIKI